MHADLTVKKKKSMYLTSDSTKPLVQEVTWKNYSLVLLFNLKNPQHFLSLFKEWSMGHGVVLSKLSSPSLNLRTNFVPGEGETEKVEALSAFSAIMVKADTFPAWYNGQ